MFIPPNITVVREAGGVRGEQLSQLQRPAGSCQQLQAAHQDHPLHARGGYHDVGDSDDDDSHKLLRHYYKLVIGV